MPTRRTVLTGAVGAGLPLLMLPLLGTSSGNPPRRLIVVWAQGGWDVTYVFDPKIGVAGIEGPERFADRADPDDVDRAERFGGLEVVVNDARRPAVTKFFAEQHARTAIVNGIWVGSIAHDPCRLRMLTGGTLHTNPDLVAISGARHGGLLPLGSVDMAGVGFSGPLAATAGSIGGSSQIKTLLDPNETFAGPGELRYPQFVPTAEDEARNRAHLRMRHEAMSSQVYPGSQRRLADFAEALSRSERLTEQASGILSQLTLGRQPGFVLMMDLATDLLAQNVCASVLVDTNMQWDTHTNNETQNGNFETLFIGLNALARHLDAKGLAETTTVVVLSEMTRTPKHNLDLGKDHWQHTSAMLFGAGVRSGTYGATDDLLESIPMDLLTGEPAPRTGSLCTYERFIAGMLAMLDIETEDRFAGVTPFLGARA